MAITYTIPGALRMNQLTEASNAQDDCVFVSCAALANWRSGDHPHLTGSQIKALDSDDYGPTYTGFASAARLVDTLARLGVKLAAVNAATQQRLVDQLHWQIEHYHQPCLITMPSQWNSAPLAAGWNPRAYRGYSHVGVMCGSGPGMLRCMNPWGGFWQDQSDAWWAQRLLYGEIWVGVYRPMVSAPQATPAVSTVSPAPTVASLQEKISAALKALQ